MRFLLVSQGESTYKIQCKALERLHTMAVLYCGWSIVKCCQYYDYVPHVQGRVDRALYPGQRVERALYLGQRVERALYPGQRVERALYPGQRVERALYRSSGLSEDLKQREDSRHNSVHTNIDVDITG